MTTITVYAPGLTVEVIDVIPAPTIANLIATPNVLPVGGGQVVIDATVMNATEITLDGVPVTLPTTVQVTASRSFELVAIGPTAPHAHASVSVAVEVYVPPPPPPPPPITAGEDPAMVYDGPAGMTSKYVYLPTVAWKNLRGDWLDADGVPQGAKPFGEAIVKTGQTTEATIDVSALVNLGGEPQLCLRSMATSGMGPQMVFNAREGGNGAKLEVTYTDGTTEVIPVSHDAECNSSTAYELGSKPTMSLSSGANIYLRFPQPAKSVVSASLVIVPNWISQGGKVQAFKFALHRDPAPTDTFTLKGDPRVFLETEAFEDDGVPYYIKAKIFGGPAPAVPDQWDQTAVVDVDGGRALQVTFDPRGSSALSASVCFPNFDEADEAAVEFDIRLMPDMLTGLRDGIKLFAGFSSSTRNDDAYFAGWAGTNTPGRCGTLLAGNGGSKSHGNDGWSHRWDAYKSPPPPHPLHGRFLPMQYAYWPGQIDYYGDPWPWTLQNTSLVAGEWYTIAQRCKVNTCVGLAYQKDAEFDGYINGRLAVRRRDYYQRTTDYPLIAQAPYNVRSKLAIGRVWLNSYHGGTTVPLARCSFQVRNFRVAKFA